MNKSSRDRGASERWLVSSGQTGSHPHFKHPTKPGKVTVPHPKKDLPLKTIKSIEKASGVKLT
jgi:predicted RNA binding protein YcfA (HicA-like mRNA interferase family)